MVFSHLPRTVLLYASAGGGWSPWSEVHLPLEAPQRLSLSFDGNELLVVAGSGELYRRHLEGGPAAAYPAPAGSADREFGSACTAAGGGFLRLALRRDRSAAGAAYTPELILAQ